MTISAALLGLLVFAVGFLSGSLGVAIALVMLWRREQCKQQSIVRETSLGTMN